MTKIRVYELAKELNISSKELMNKIESLGLEVSSHMSSIDKEDADLIVDLLSESKPSIQANADDHNDEYIAEEEPVEEKSIDVIKQKNRKNKKNKSKKEVEKEIPKNNESGEIIIEIGENIVVKDLAEKLNLNVSQVITKLIGMGVMATQNQSIDGETAAIIAEEFGAAVEFIPVETNDVTCSYGNGAC